MQKCERKRIQLSSESISSEEKEEEKVVAFSDVIAAKLTLHESVH